MRFRLSGLIAVAVLACAGSPLVAVDPPKPMATKVYCVADLVVPYPELAVQKLLSCPPRGDSAKQQLTVAESGGKLVQLVTSMVRPYSWSDAGGAGKAEFVELGFALAVHNTPDVHQEIADLLEGLRRLQNRQLSTQVYVVTVPAGFSERVGLKCDATPALGDREMRLLMEAVQAHREANVVQLPKVTTFDDQTATVTAGDRRTFVTGVEAKKVNGVAVMVPKNMPVDLGLTMKLNGRVSADQKFVKLQVKVERTTLTGPVELVPVVTQVTPVYEGGSQGKPVEFTQFLQAPDLKTVAVEKTVTVPTGGTVVLGGWKDCCEESSPPMTGKIPYINRLFKNATPAAACETIVLATTHAVPGEQPEHPARQPVAEPFMPERYGHATRQLVVTPFAQQVQNGQIVQDAIWNWCFEPGTARLTRDGVKKLEALATARPAPNPAVYLQTARDVVATPDNAETVVALRNALTRERAVVVRNFLQKHAGAETAFEIQVLDTANPPAAPARYAEVRTMRHVAAMDAAAAVNQYLVKSAPGTIAIAEPVSNTVLVTGEKALVQQVSRDLASMDVAPPKVLTQAMILEVPADWLADIGLKQEEGKPLVLTERELAMFHAAIRRQKEKGDLDILGRPQILVTDNQTGYVQMGSKYPYVSKTDSTGKETIEYYPIGVSMRVTPRIHPDGKILLRVEPRITSVNPKPVNLGDGTHAHVFNEQSLQAQLVLREGQTAILCGGVSKTARVSAKEDGPGKVVDEVRRQTIIVVTPHRVKDEVVRPAAHTQPAVAPVLVPMAAPRVSTWSPVELPTPAPRR